jgi:hypothetical protein
MMSMPRKQTLPKRFLLTPSSDGSLEVTVARQCLGYIWPDHDRWLARDSEGALLDTGTGESALAAVSAVFQACGDALPAY